ncbi:hypothetical protein Tco_0154725, partial [Tanacetum coccineum]
CVKVYPIDPQENEHAATIEQTVSNKVLENSSDKRLQDLLLEDQSDTYSVCSDTSEYADDDSHVPFRPFPNASRISPTCADMREYNTRRRQ